MLAGVEVIDFAPAGHPSDVDFRGWLARRTPPDAPTLVISLPGARAPLRLPQLRTPALAPARRRGRRGRGLAPALHAACLVDIEGLTHRQIAASGLLGFGTERAARQHARDGRFVASELGLWPWAAVGGRSLPRAWWLDEVFAEALKRWATEIRVPEVEPAVGAWPARRRAKPASSSCRTPARRRARACRCACRGATRTDHRRGCGPR